MSDLQAIFAAQGLLAKALLGYRFRPQQMAMAEKVAAAIRNQMQLVVEAGTGTGKTFAYLVPALLSGGKVILSTGTKTLQDQLFHRDLPLIRKVLRVPVTAALLKGRANYLCHYHLEQTQASATLESRTEVKQLAAIAQFARTDPVGDKSALPQVPENAAIWNRVTSTRDNCLGSDCPHYRECFVINARREALKADVVVVNHHLFFADVMLRDEGLAELLPNCNTVIFDEAHHLPETATLFFGERVSSGQLSELIRDSRVEAWQGARDNTEFTTLLEAIEHAMREFRLILGDEKREQSRAELLDEAQFTSALMHFISKLQSLHGGLLQLAERSEGLARCALRCQELLDRILRWKESAEQNWVRWLEVTRSGWQLQATPLSVAEIFNRQLAESARSWIFTSATLSVGGDFSHYRAELGLDGAEEGCWDSPFDYASQALLYVPQDLPPPNQDRHTLAVVQAALPVIKATRGRTFMLFTTLRALDRARELLRQICAEQDLPWSLLVQGEGSRSELLERFRSAEQAVLLGSQTFWQGVDVRGEALSVVVIDKLPFAPPDDPVVAARMDYLAKQDKNPFMDYQLPQAVLSLKQGAGRLIRSETDRGVLMICDPRLISKAYGKLIWKSLPPMRRTRDLQEVLDFFAPAELAKP